MLWEDLDLKDRKDRKVLLVRKVALDHKAQQVRKDHKVQHRQLLDRKVLRVQLVQTVFLLVQFRLMLAQPPQRGGCCVAAQQYHVQHTRHYLR